MRQLRTAWSSVHPGGLTASRGPEPEPPAVNPPVAPRGSGLDVGAAGRCASGNIRGDSGLAPYKGSTPARFIVRGLYPRTIGCTGVGVGQHPPEHHRDLPAQSRCRGGRGEPSPREDVGRGEPSPSGCTVDVLTVMRLHTLGLGLGLCSVRCRLAFELGCARAARPYWDHRYCLSLVFGGRYCFPAHRCPYRTAKTYQPPFRLSGNLLGPVFWWSARRRAVLFSATDPAGGFGTVMAAACERIRAARIRRFIRPLILLTLAVVRGFGTSGYASHPLVLITPAVVRGFGTSGYAWKGPSEMMPACRSNLTDAAVSAPSEYCAVLRGALRTYAGRYGTLGHSGVLCCLCLGIL